MENLRYALTWRYWKPTQRYILQLIVKGKFSHVGKTGVVKIASGNSLAYTIIEDGFPIAWVFMKRRPRWAAFEVHQTYVLQKHRRKGLAEKLYKVAINDGVILATGGAHTKYSKKMWAKFIERKLFRVWAHDFKDLSRTAEIEYDEGLICGLPLYHPPSKSMDVRIVAIKKSK